VTNRDTDCPIADRWRDIVKYQPAYKINPANLNLVAEIGETVGCCSVLDEQNLTLRL
jgi:hypothetical protein